MLLFEARNKMCQYIAVKNQLIAIAVGIVDDHIEVETENRVAAIFISEIC